MDTCDCQPVRVYMSIAPNLFDRITEAIQCPDSHFLKIKKYIYREKGGVFVILENSKEKAKARQDRKASV